MPPLSPAKRITKRKLIIFSVAFILIIVTALYWINNRYEPRVQNILSSKVDNLYYSGLEEHLATSSIYKGCGASGGDFDFTQSRACNVTRYLKLVKVTEEEIDDKLTQIQATLQQQGMTATKPLTVDFNARGYIILMHMRSKDDACTFLLSFTRADKELERPLTGWISCNKDMPFKGFFI